MNLVEEVKRAYRLNDKELCELETGIERMELERQMSHDTLDLLMEKVRRVFVCTGTVFKVTVQRRYDTYDMNGRFQMQGGKTGICQNTVDQYRPVLLGLSLAGNLVKPLMSLYGTEWRDRSYGLRGSMI
jgi:hypothetical protein